VTSSASGDSGVIKMPGVDRSARGQSRRARVLAIDDQTVFLAVLRELVSATRELEPAAEAQSGEMAIEAAREFAPDVVLMDVWMPGMGGIAAAKEIKANRPSTVVVLISSTHPDELPLESDDICADAIIWKSELAPRQLDDIWLRHQGQHSPSPS
jgi:DNA-binding NarL/FixJ family response regulator